MENEEQYLTEKHYLVCTKGIMPKRLCVDTQHYTRFSGDKAATAADLQKTNVFVCVGSVAFAAGAAVGIACCCVPGPGWVLALVIAAILAAAAIWGVIKCQKAAPTRIWDPSTVSPVLTIHTDMGQQPALMLSSVMMCPQEGGTITAKETLWEAWGTQALTNLGHLVDFAFGFLVGRGAGAIAGEGIAAYGTASAGGSAFSTAVGTGLRTAGRSFWQTAKKELISQFNPFGSWKGRSWICNALRGFGLVGAYWNQWNIWSDDEKSLLEKIEASSVSLILDVFAAKGMTLVCFPAGTKVHTQWGLADIERLEEGVPVLTYNEETGEKEYKPVLKTSRRMTQHMCVVELSNGQSLEVTPEHRFFCGGEWVPIEELEVGSTLQTRNNEYLVIENKTIVFKFVEVYNLEVQDNENYYVTEEGVLVHNGYKDELNTRNNVARGDAGTYQSRTVGDVEYHVQGGGESVWADGIDDATNFVQDAKYVGNAQRSPFIEGSDCPPFVREQILDNLDDEFYRYSQVINDPSNPIEGLEVITNNENAVTVFEDLMNTHNIPGNVTIKK